MLDLCWKYLRNSVPGRRCDSDSDLELSDDDDDEGRGGDHFSRSKPRNLNICLGLILDYLDTDLASGRAWTILSENLRIICLLGQFVYQLAPPKSSPSHHLLSRNRKKG